MGYRQRAWRIRFFHGHRGRTRTYHGLLVAAPENSPGRLLLLSSLDEEISIDEEVYRLATHKYPDISALKASITPPNSYTARFLSGFTGQGILP